MSQICVGEHVNTRPFVFLAMAIAFAAVSGCKAKGEAGAAPSVDAAPTVSATAPARPALPPEPVPPVADKASEVPELEAKLAADKAYAAVWSGPRADLNLFLTAVSELLAAGGASTDITKPLREKKLFDAAIKLHMVFARVGRYPTEFTTKLEAHLSQVKSEPHLGVWSPFAKKGDAIYDATALVSWLHSEDPAYLRERLAAKGSGGGPLRWTSWTEKDAPARPWLVDESAALDRLGLLTKLTPEEESRSAFLKAEAKKPRQPKLGEEFKLGDFTYVVKSVELAGSVGNGPFRKSASEGGQFVLVHFTIRNDGSATETVSTDDFKILDAKGREYRPSAEANTALSMSGNKDYLLTELQPGLKKSTATAFEMPEEAANGVFTLVVPEKGLLGTGSVRITLK